MDKSNKLKEMVAKLEEKYTSIDLSQFIAPRIKRTSLFEFIIGVMLSQNTSDKNAIKAYENLKRICGGRISPGKILSMGKQRLSDTIRVAGMYKSRTSNILELAKIFSTPGFEEKLVSQTKKLDTEEARKILMKLPGVGPKTADVVLLMYFGKPTFPVDTHIRRITKRLGYLERYDYESIRRFWMRIVPENKYLRIHLILITHGRTICRARNPRCSECPIKEYCKYYTSTSTSIPSNHSSDNKAG